MSDLSSVSSCDCKKKDQIKSYRPTHSSVITRPSLGFSCFGETIMGSSEQEDMRFSLQGYHLNDQHHYSNLASSMEMLSFPPLTPKADPGSKMTQAQQLPSSSITSDFYQPNLYFSQNQYDPALSLSITAKQQPFELGESSYEHLQDHDQLPQDEFYGRLLSQIYQQHQFLGLQGDQDHNRYDHESLMKVQNSKYLVPIQELLNELCKTTLPEPKKNRSSAQQNISPSFAGPSLDSLELFELEDRKAKLLFMLDQVDGRYEQYCNRVKSTESVFEAVAGRGSGKTYTKFASNAMSKHMKRLKNGILTQLKATKKALMKKGAPGTSREGETPRVRLLDQSLRQQNSYQHSIMEGVGSPWRPQRGLPERSVGILRDWLMGNFLNPYPSELDKRVLASKAGLTKSQVSNWFINARVRLWKPMVEEMYLEETNEQNNIETSNAVQELDENSRPGRPCGHKYNRVSHDQKPSLEQLARNDSGSITSHINNPDIGEHRPQHQQHLSAFAQTDLDFSNFNSDFIYGNSSLGHGISLTLGLQQHDGSTSGVNLPPFSSPDPSEKSIFVSRHHLDQVPYLMLDGCAPSLPPYNN